METRDNYECIMAEVLLVTLLKYIVWIGAYYCWPGISFNILGRLDHDIYQPWDGRHYWHLLPAAAPLVHSLSQHHDV